MSNQQNQNPATASQENLRGATENVQAIDESGFAPQGSVKGEMPEGTALSTTDFSDEPVAVPSIVGDDAEPQAENEDPQPVALADEVAPSVEEVAAEVQADNQAVGFDGEPVDHEQVEASVDSAFKPPVESSTDVPVDEDLGDDTEFEEAADEILDSLDTVMSSGAGESKTSLGTWSATAPLVGFALKLASLGILVKSVDGDLHNLNESQSKGYGETTAVAQMLWTAKIPSGGFAEMTGAQYLRALNHLLETSSRGYGFKVDFLIAPEDKSLDSIDDLGEAIEKGNLITLQSAIEQRIKISKHHILIIISGADSHSPQVAVEAVADNNVAGFYILHNTLEVIAPGLHTMARYIAKLASTGRYAINVDDTAGFYTTFKRHHVPAVVGFDQAGNQIIGEEELLEVMENYSISILETDYALKDAINPIITPSRILDMLNNIVEDAGVERYSSVAVTSNPTDSYFAQLGGGVHRVSFLLSQAWDIQISDEAIDEDDEDEDDSEE